MFNIKFFKILYFLKFETIRLALLDPNYRYINEQMTEQTTCDESNKDGNNLKKKPKKYFFLKKFGNGLKVPHTSVMPQVTDHCPDH